MKRFILCSLALILLAFGALACGEIPAPVRGGPTPLPLQATPVPLQPTSLPLQPRPEPAPSWPAEAQPLVDLVIAAAAKQAGVAPGDVAVVEFEEVRWTNGCLDCAKPGEMCTDVIVPGYRLLVRAGGQEYEYHTNKTDNVVLCQGNSQAGDWGSAQPLVEAAIADLAGRLGVDRSQISVVQVTQKDWNDSSLGCPQPGQAYLTVITPGYQIILAAGGKQYDYRTGRQSRLILCEK